MSTAAGTRNKRIRIEERGNAKDEANQPLDVWNLVTEKFASYRTGRGMSAVRSAQEGVPTGPQRVSWGIAYTPTGISPAMRVNWNGLLYDIVEVRHDHATKKWTDLVCDAGGANQ